MLQNEVYERARLSRDSRFDGQFFVGVKTTGIYCRPICPANAPKSQNVSFFPTAAAASEAGFRPCLRCRPECAPGTPAWAGTSTTVRRGLRLIANGALDEGNVEDLAGRLGVSSRHLRRLFTKHLGASPQSVAHTQRLHFAKRLIDDTSMPMQDIAIASGYGSVRRFNDAFRSSYGRSPRDLRRRSDANPDLAGTLSIKLRPRDPFDGSSLLGFFAARAIPGVEAVRDGRYLRSVRVGDSGGIVEVRQLSDSLHLDAHGVGTAGLFSVVQRCREIFDTDAPVAEIVRVLSADRRLRSLYHGHEGIRVPGAWDGFELTVRAILGQQISVKAATTLAGRIAHRYGDALDPELIATVGAPDVSLLFPGPERLMRARFNDMGLTTGRAETIRRVARAVVDGKVRFDSSQDPEEFRAAMMSIRGIGDWTTEYVAMRALKNPDAFPASDLGLLRAFDSPCRPRLRPQELAEKAERWRPWRAYAALLLWSAASGSGG